jgi:hypothetical protein
MEEPLVPLEHVPSEERLSYREEEALLKEEAAVLLTNPSEFDRYEALPNTPLTLLGYYLESPKGIGGDKSRAFFTVKIPPPPPGAPVERTTFPTLTGKDVPEFPAYVSTGTNYSIAQQNKLSLFSGNCLRIINTNYLNFCIKKNFSNINEYITSDTKLTDNYIKKLFSHLYTIIYPGQVSESPKFPPKILSKWIIKMPNMADYRGRNYYSTDYKNNNEINVLLGSKSAGRNNRGAIERTISAGEGINVGSLQQMLTRRYSNNKLFYSMRNLHKYKPGEALLLKNKINYENTGYNILSAYKSNKEIGVNNIFGFNLNKIAYEPPELQIPLKYYKLLSYLYDILFMDLYEGLTGEILAQDINDVISCVKNNFAKFKHLKILYCTETETERKRNIY